VNDLKHTVEDVMSLPSTHMADQGTSVPQRCASDDPTVDIEALEYYRTLHGRHTMWARAALLTVIVSMLGANMWLTQRNYHTVIVNMDQARLAQAQLMDQQATMLDQQQNILVLQQGLGAVEDALQAGTIVPAVPAVDASADAITDVDLRVD